MDKRQKDIFLRWVEAASEETGFANGIVGGLFLFIKDLPQTKLLFEKAKRIVEKKGFTRIDSLKGYAQAGRSVDLMNNLLLDLRIKRDLRWRQFDPLKLVNDYSEPDNNNKIAIDDVMGFVGREVTELWLHHLIDAAVQFNRSMILFASEDVTKLPKESFALRQDIPSRLRGCFPVRMSKLY